MKRFTERLLELERKARETVFDNKSNETILTKTDKKNEKIDRSLKKNDDHYLFQTKSKSKSKLSHHQSYPQLSQTSSNSFPLRKIKTMSAINIFSIESQTRSPSILPFSITNQEKTNPIVKEKQISFEVKTNSYNRKVQVKTKQEETICTTKKSVSPTIITRIIKTETPPSMSPHRVSVVRQQRRSSSKSFIFYFFN